MKLLSAHFPWLLLLEKVTSLHLCLAGAEGGKVFADIYSELQCILQCYPAGKMVQTLIQVIR